MAADLKVAVGANGTLGTYGSAANLMAQGATPAAGAVVLASSGSMTAPPAPVSLEVLHRQFAVQFAHETADLPQKYVPPIQGRAGTILSREMDKELKKSLTKFIVKNADMENELQNEALDYIISAVDKYKEKGKYEEAARQIKEKMEDKFGSPWHCIIGEAYGFKVACENKHMLFLYYGNLAILLYKC